MTVSHCPKRVLLICLLLQDETLAYYAGYDKQEVQPVVDLMIDYLARPVVHEAFFKKYASKKFLKGMSCPKPVLLCDFGH